MDKQMCIYTYGYVPIVVYMQCSIMFETIALILWLFYISKSSGKDILPYLGQLMPFLMNAVRSAPTEGKELAISAIGATGKVFLR